MKYKMSERASYASFGGRAVPLDYVSFILSVVEGLRTGFSQGLFQTKIRFFLKKKLLDRTRI